MQCNDWWWIFVVLTDILTEGPNNIKSLNFKTSWNGIPDSASLSVVKLHVWYILEKLSIKKFCRCEKNVFSSPAVLHAVTKMKPKELEISFPSDSCLYLTFDVFEVVVRCAVETILACPTLPYITRVRAYRGLVTIQPSNCTNVSSASEKQPKEPNCPSDPPGPPRPGFLVIVAMSPLVCRPTTFINQKEQSSVYT